jgi:hypothetical protein
MSAAPELQPVELTAQDLLAGAGLSHDIDVPREILRPAAPGSAPPGRIRLRPLTVGTLALISRAAREDVSLIPLLMIKEGLAQPALSLDQIRQLHIGLVDFIVGQINRISGLTLDGEALGDAAAGPVGTTHLLLARHFGWTPEQVSQLTPAQVAIYLAGVERLLELDRHRENTAR